MVLIGHLRQTTTSVRPTAVCYETPYSRGKAFFCGRICCEALVGKMGRNTHGHVREGDEENVGEETELLSSSSLEGLDFDR